MTPLANGHSARTAHLLVRRVVRETADSVTIAFERPDDPRFDHQPGQFLTLRLPSDLTGHVARCYSLCSAPHDSELAVTVKRTHNGYGSNWVCDNIRVGDRVEVLPPSGTFVPTSLDGELLLIGGGSGITPMMSILRATLESGTGTAVLVYANRDEHSVIFAGVLNELVARYAHRLTVIHWLTSVQGIPSLESLRGLLSPFAHREVFICGPEPFMDCAYSALEALGATRDRIHVERFRSLAGDPFGEPDSLLPAIGADDDDVSNLTVRLDGQTHTLDWPRSISLIDLLLSKDIDAPYSCREGACGSCVCRVIEGDVTMEFSDTLDPEDIDDGYVLGCQARTASERIVIEF